MEMTLRWAKRSKKFFEEHKHEVPWNEVASSELRGARKTFQEPEPKAGSQAGDEQALRPTEAFARNSQLATGNSFPQLATGNSFPQLATRNSQTLFGIVQGGMDPDLRRESALRTVEIGFPGYAIGGLSVGEPRHVTREIVEATLEHLPKDKPRYLMGVGTPEEIAEYAQLGVDMMDCVLPTRAARHGLLFTSEGKISIKQARYASDPAPLDPHCGCRVCTRYSRAYLRHLYASNEVLAQVLNTIHNLSFYLDTMQRVRDAISLGDSVRFLSGTRPSPKP
jgi:tRNA-guanine transglycosylase